MNKIYDKLTTLDFAIIAIYLVALLLIGYIASFKNKKKNETLFLASNSLSWYSIGFNMWGTNVGPSSLLAFASIGTRLVLLVEILNGTLLYFYCYWQWFLRQGISPAK